MCWVAENNCPFAIVSDRGFRFLMKTGQPHYYIPFPWTVLYNVRLIFAWTWQHIAAMLMVSYCITTTSKGCLICVMKKYEGRLSFATDAWTSPNHQAFVTITMHLVSLGKPLSMVLDIVKVPISHTGINLAQVLTQVLNNFGISDKVSMFTQVNVNHLSLHVQIFLITCDNATNNDTMVTELAHHLPEYSAVNQS